MGSVPRRLHPRFHAVRECDALLALGPLITAATLKDAVRLAVVARIGVGYDSVDVEACTREGVALTITPDGVRRPVASAALAFLLALAHRLPLKDRLTREGRWSEKADHMGIGLRAAVWAWSVSETSAGRSAAWQRPLTCTCWQRIRLAMQT